MQVQIKEVSPFSIAGYASRHRMPGMGNLSDIPCYWEKVNLEYAATLVTLHKTYTKSRHCEVAVCFDHDAAEDSFTYMLGVGVDSSELDKPRRPGIYLHQIPGGLYAVFTTPQVGEAEYTRCIHETWREILENRIPASDYEFDSTREEFEYYDERDHGSMAQMDIYIPVCKRM